MNGTTGCGPVQETKFEDLEDVEKFMRIRSAVKGLMQERERMRREIETLRQALVHHTHAEGRVLTPPDTYPNIIYVDGEDKGWL